MRKPLVSALTLLGLTACATEETREEQDLAAACEPHTHTLTSSGNSLYIDGDLFATITCSDYDDPRIGGTTAELGEYLDEKCTVTYGTPSHNTGCDEITAPVSVDPATGVVTVTRCVDACSGDIYTAEGGTWVDVPVESGLYDYVCDLEGAWAGCCDFFDVKPDVLASCDRYFEYADGVWHQVSTSTNGTPAGTSASIARTAPSTPAVPSTNAAAGLDNVINSVKNVILGTGVIVHMALPPGEYKEKLGKMLHEAQHMIETKEKLKPVPVPGPVPKGPLNPPGTVPPPRAGGVLVPTRPPTTLPTTPPTTVPGTIPRPGAGPTNPATQPKTTPPVPPVTPKK